MTDPKYTDTTPVNQGVATLTVNQTLTPGTYTINGLYPQTDNYQEGADEATLTITQTPTLAVLQTNNESIPIGNSVIFTATLTDTNTTPITEGTFTLYEDNTPVVFQQSLNNNGQCTLNYIPVNLGEHNYKIVYSGSGIYESVTSSTYQVSVVRKTSTLTVNQNTLNLYYNTSGVIRGTLTTENNTPVNGGTILLYDYDNTYLTSTTTGNDGSFTLQYTLNDTNCDGETLTVLYEQTGTNTSTSTTINVNLIRHNVTLTVPSVTGYVDDTVPITVTALDENGDNVTSGSLTLSITPQGNVIELTGTVNSVYTELVFPTTTLTQTQINDITTNIIGEDWDLYPITAAVYDSTSETITLTRQNKDPSIDASFSTSFTLETSLATYEFTATYTREDGGEVETVIPL